MKKLFSNGANSVIGLDVGSYSAKAVQLTLNQTQTRLDAYSEVPTKSVDLNNPRVFTDIVNRTLVGPSYGKYSAKYLVIKLPGHLTNHQVVGIDNPQNKFLHSSKSTAQHIRSYLGADKKVLIDYDLLKKPSESGNRTYLATIAPEDLGLAIKYGLAENNLDNFKLGTLLTAISTTITDGVDLPNHYIDIGHRTSRYVFFNNDIYMHQDIPFGANDFAEHLAKELGVDTDAVFTILKTHGLYDGEHAAKARHSLQRSGSKLLDSLSSQIASNNSVFNNTELNNTLVVYGSIGTIPGLTAFLSKELTMPVVLPQPWSQANIYPLKPIPKHRLPIYSTAIGLAMSAR